MDRQNNGKNGHKAGQKAGQKCKNTKQKEFQTGANK